MEYIENGTKPKDKKDLMLLIDELKLWCFEEAEVMRIQEVMMEPLPLSVGEKVIETWNKIGPLDVTKLVEMGIYEIDDALYIEDIDIEPKYKGQTNYEGQVDDENKPHGIGKWTTYQIISNVKIGEVTIDHANIGMVYEGSFRKGKKSGDGRLVYADGSYFEGYFLDGLP